MIFFEDDNSFSLHAEPLKLGAVLIDGLWLVLVNVNETPPHIALISEGKYYSLSARKVDNGSPLGRFMNAINRKHIPTLFVRIETKNDKIIYLENIYKEFYPLNNTEKTCLAPIKEIFTTLYSNDITSINYVFELLALLEKKALLKECLSYFCKTTTTNIVTLPKYTIVEIQNKILALSSPRLNHI